MDPAGWSIAIQGVLWTVSVWLTLWAIRERRREAGAEGRFVDGCACCEAGCGETAGNGNVCLICNH